MLQKHNAKLTELEEWIQALVNQIAIDDKEIQDQIQAYSCTLCGLLDHLSA